jgi:hypothetical protein
MWGERETGCSSRGQRYSRCTTWTFGAEVDCSTSKIFLHPFQANKRILPQDRPRTLNLYFECLRSCCVFEIRVRNFHLRNLFFLCIFYYHSLFATCIYFFLKMVVRTKYVANKKIIVKNTKTGCVDGKRSPWSGTLTLTLLLVHDSVQSSS